MSSTARGAPGSGWPRGAAFSDLFLVGLPVLAVGLAAALLLPNVPLAPRGQR